MKVDTKSQWVRNPGERLPTFPLHIPINITCFVGLWPIQFQVFHLLGVDSSHGELPMVKGKKMKTYMACGLPSRLRRPAIRRMSNLRWHCWRHFEAGERQSIERKEAIRRRKNTVLSLRHDPTFWDWCFVDVLWLFCGWFEIITGNPVRVMFYFPAAFDETHWRAISSEICNSNLDISWDHLGWRWSCWKLVVLRQDDWGHFPTKLYELLWGTGISTWLTSVAVTTGDVAHIDSDDTSRVTGK